MEKNISTVEVKLFGRDDCQKCAQAKEIFKNYFSSLSVEYYDVDTVDGLSSALNFQIASSLPTIIIMKDGREIKRWSGELPKIQEIEQVITEVG